MQPLDEVFFALSDPTRRAILASLAQGDLTVAELSEPFEISAPAISKHLRVLERAGLLVREREGRSRRARFVADPLQGAAEWVDRYRDFWENKLDGLAEYLETPGSEGESRTDLTDSIDSTGPTDVTGSKDDASEAG